MENQLIRERYELSMERISKFLEENTVKAPYLDYFRNVSSFIALCGEVMDAVRNGSIAEWTKEKLVSYNGKLYSDLVGEAYETSYANPAYAVKVFGEELGKNLCFLYTEILK